MQTAIQHSNNLLSVEAEDAGGHAGIRLDLGDGDSFLQARAPQPQTGPVVVVDSDDEQAGPSAAAAPPVDNADADAVWDLGGCLLVPGLKHICSNIQGDVLSRLSHYSKFQEQVKALNTLLHQKFYRDRVKELFKGKATEKLFNHYDGGALILWRWGSLVKVCESFHRREGALRTSWSLERFLATSRPQAGGPRGRAGPDTNTDALEGEAPLEGSDQGQGDDQLTFRKADSAIRSSYFWSYNKLILILAGVLEDLSSWCEGCPCHNKSSAGRDCPLRGRRAPEAACGEFKRWLDETMSTAASMFLAAASGLGHNSREWRELSTDWNTACDLIEAEVQTKSSHWRSLPWLLCGVASPNTEEARATARLAIEMFDQESTQPHHLAARRHRISARFLSWNYHGSSSSDVPLRPLLRDFVMGASLEEPHCTLYITHGLRESLGLDGLGHRCRASWAGSRTESVECRV